jgi:hypothetical protein
VPVVVDGGQQVRQPGQDAHDDALLLGVALLVDRFGLQPIDGGPQQWQLIQADVVEGQRSVEEPGQDKWR